MEATILWGGEGDRVKEIDMGFSLEMFFNELLEMLDNSDMQSSGDAQTDLRNIYEYVKNQRDYAKECGQLLPPNTCKKSVI